MERTEALVEHLAREPTDIEMLVVQPHPPFSDIALWSLRLEAPIEVAAVSYL